MPLASMPSYVATRNPKSRMSSWLERWSFAAHAPISTGLGNRSSRKSMKWMRRNHPSAWVASSRRPQAWGFGTCSGMYVCSSIRLRYSASSWDRPVRSAAYLQHYYFHTARAHIHTFIRYLDEILSLVTIRHFYMYAARRKVLALTVCVCGDGLTPRWSAGSGSASSDNLTRWPESSFCGQLRQLGVCSPDA